MRCSSSLILLSGCLLSVPLQAEDKPPSTAGTDSAAAPAYVIDLYVDTKTKQIYSEPGEGRVRMGSFEKVSDQKPAPKAGAEAGGAGLPASAASGAVAAAAPKPQGMGYANWKSPDPFKWNLNPDGSQYLKFGFLNQVWLRYEQNNPGSQVLGDPVKDTQDIGLRRTRFVLQGQLTDRVYFYTQYGMNNFNFLTQDASTQHNGSDTPIGNRKIQAFFHDAFGELRLTKGHQMIVGAGLVMANGASRFSSPSVSTIMTMDIPLFAQFTADRTDIFNRSLSVYLRGQIGMFNYRFTASDPFPINTSGTGFETISPTMAQFARQGHHKRYQGFYAINFWDTEPMTNPYWQGTYLGKKSILNLEGGFITQKAATWTGTPVAGGGETNVQFHDMTIWSLALYLDAPVDKVKETAISAYLGYFDTNYGPNYLRMNGIGMAPATGGQGPFATGGNQFPMFGTGKLFYGQIGYLLPKDLLGSNNGQLMPYFSWTNADYQALQHRVDVFNVGVNWLIKGHNSKVTFDYQNRPVFNNAGDKIANRGQFVLQYQIAF
ncbi:MAG TPA: hypothetical protein VFI43_10155 [Nitrosospira sp.]|nr:hypothetical protein [Nitrosospira sp.]